MLIGLRRERSETCLSDLALDEWHASELDAEGEAAAHAHIVACERCRRRMADLDADRERFLALAPVFRAPARVTTSKRTAAFSRIGLATALAAGLGFAAFLALRLETRDASDGAVATGDRVKGSHRIGFYVKRGEQTSEGIPGQRVLPGDRLRFVVTARSAVHVAILSLDGAGRVSTYYPPEGDVAGRLESGADQPLPGAIELDATLGR